MIVKVHGVFPSNRKKLASSRVFQIHQDYVGDSEEIVTPFMQVGTSFVMQYVSILIRLYLQLTI